jgi:hypothetical protein
MKSKITIEQADALIEKYYSAETTGAEEALLREFLLQDGLPCRFDPERALFGFFSDEKVRLSAPASIPWVVENKSLPEETVSRKEKPPRSLFVRMAPILKWSFAAAVVISGVLIFNNQVMGQNRNIAYIDGIRCTDSKKVTALAIASVQQIDLQSDEVEDAISKMSDKNMVEKQLQPFPAFE